MGIMRRSLFICVAALFAALPSLAATNIIDKVTPDKPLRYERRNGRLEVRSLITLSTAPEGPVSLALDGKPLACEVGPAPKTLCAWLPLVGGESRLDVIQGGRVASSFRTVAPIDGDWGYFANGEICMIQSSHQDIAWMDTPAKPRLDEVCGERPNLWLYIHGPAHYEQTLDKRRAAISLPAAEGISALNAIARGKPYPYDALSRGWMASIYPDHGLGGKNGDITDRIFGEHLAKARKIGDETLYAGLETLASDVSGKAGDIELFNTFAQPRTAIATVSSQDSRIPGTAPGHHAIETVKIYP